MILVVETHRRVAGERKGIAGCLQQAFMLGVRELQQHSHGETRERTTAAPELQPECSADS